jgi:hypothetical protein
MTIYAWVITKDHLFDTAMPVSDINTNDAGVSGPKNASADLIEQTRTKGVTFKLYDDDGELYYTGKLFQPDGQYDVEEISYAPLGDFGQGWAGCTSVRYPGHPEWDCG